MDKNDILRQINAAKAELQPKLAAYQKLVDGAVNEKKEPRAFTPEEWSAHEQLGKEINALNAQITVAKAMLQAAKLADEADDVTASDFGLSGAHKLPHATDEYREKFCAFMAAGAKREAAAPLYEAFAGGRFENLTGTSPSTGEVLIPTTLERAILMEAAAESPLLMLSNVVMIGTRKNQVPFIGDIGVMAPRGEAESYVKAEPTLAAKTLDIFNFGSLFPVSMELMEDAEQLEAMFAEIYGRSLGETVEEYGLKGTGGQADFTTLADAAVTLTLTGKVPPGILTLASGTVPSHTSAAATAISYEDIINLKQKVKPAAGRSGSFMVSKGFETAALLLKDTTGRPIWMPSLSASTPATLAGSAYHVSDKLEAVAASKTTALYGDFKRAHRIAMRKGLTVKTSGHFYFGNNSMAVAADVRFGALVLLKEYIAKLVQKSS